MLYLGINKYMFLALTSWATWHLRNALFSQSDTKPCLLRFRSRELYTSDGCHGDRMEKYEEICQNIMAKCVVCVCMWGVGGGGSMMSC